MSIVFFRIIFKPAYALLFSQLYINIFSDQEYLTAGCLIPVEFYLFRFFLKKSIRITIPQETRISSNPGVEG